MHTQTLYMRTSMEPVTFWSVNLHFVVSVTVNIDICILDDLVGVKNNLH